MSGVTAGIGIAAQAIKGIVKMVSGRAPLIAHMRLPDRGGYYAIVRPGKRRIIRKRRQSLMYLAALTPQGVPIWTSDKGEAQLYVGEDVFRDMAQLRRSGHARVD